MDSFTHVFPIPAEIHDFISGASVCPALFFECGYASLYVTVLLCFCKNGLGQVSGGESDGARHRTDGSEDGGLHHT